MDATSSASSCATSALQSANLRISDGKVVDGKKSFNLQVHNQTPNEWHTVLSSVVKIELPRMSPDSQYLAYVMNMPVQGHVTPWLYLHKLSNGWREVVSVLRTEPKDLCFDSQSTSLNLVDSSGAVLAQDLAEQIKLLTRSDLGAQPSTLPNEDCTQPGYQTVKRVEYPLDAILEHKMGKSIIQVTVEAKGTPTNLSVHSTSGSVVLDEAALSAVKDYRFIPKKCNGHAVSSPALVPVNFSIRWFDDDALKFVKDDKQLEFKDVTQEVDFLVHRRDTQRGLRDVGNVFYAPKESLMWIVRTSRDGSQTAVVRIRPEHAEKMLDENYAMVCNGSAAWCSQQLTDVLDFMRRFPLPKIEQDVSE